MDIRGFLEKKADHVDLWDQRWFVLREDTLSCFMDETEVTLTKEYLITTTATIKLLPQNGEREFVFTVKDAEHPNFYEDLILSAYDESSMQDWNAAFFERSRNPSSRSGLSSSKKSSSSMKEMVSVNSPMQDMKGGGAPSVKEMVSVNSIMEEKSCGFPTEPSIEEMLSVGMDQHFDTKTQKYTFEIKIRIVPISNPSHSGLGPPYIVGKSYSKYLELHDALASKGIHIDSVFPRKFKRSFLGVDIGEENLLQRHELLHKWIEKVLIGFHIYSKESQTLISHFLHNADVHQTAGVAMSALLRTGKVVPYAETQYPAKGKVGGGR